MSRQDYLSMSQSALGDLDEARPSSAIADSTDRVQTDDRQQLLLVSIQNSSEEANCEQPNLVNPAIFSADGPVVRNGSEQAVPVSVIDCSTAIPVGFQVPEASAPRAQRRRRSRSQPLHRRFRPSPLPRPPPFVMAAQLPPGPSPFLPAPVCYLPEPGLDRPFDYFRMSHTADPNLLSVADFLAITGSPSYV